MCRFVGGKTEIILFIFKERVVYKPGHHKTLFDSPASLEETEKWIKQGKS